MSTQTTTRFAGTPMDRAIAACLQGNVPVGLMSGPGVGKSERIANLIRSFGHHVEVIDTSVRDKSDMLGLPAEDAETKSTVFYSPDWSKRLNAHAQGAVAIIEEFRNSDEEVMKACHRLLQERYAGDYKLSDNVRMVMVYNDPNTATGGGGEFPPAVANRFAHLVWQYNLDEWLDGITIGFGNLTYPSMQALAPRNPRWESQFAGLVAAFVQSNPQMAVEDTSGGKDSLREAEMGNAWASLRSWHNLVKVSAYTHPDDETVLRMLVNGLVGERVGRPFLDFVKAQTFIDPVEALDHPERVQWGMRPDRFFAFSRAVTATVAASRDPQMFTKATALATAGVRAGDSGNATTLAFTILKVCPDGARFAPGFQQEFAELMVAAGMLEVAS